MASERAGDDDRGCPCGKCGAAGAGGALGVNEQIHAEMAAIGGLVAGLSLPMRFMLLGKFRLQAQTLRVALGIEETQVAAGQVVGTVRPVARPLAIAGWMPAVRDEQRGMVGGRIDVLG